jgi:SAM-dependent methyltransferase
MNRAHECCGSDEWRQMIRDVILPWAIGAHRLGDDVLEGGPGYGATTDAACFTMLHHVGPAERQDRLFAEVARVLRPEAVLVAGDSLAGEPLQQMHDGDT